ncbi:MAG: transposase [Anaerolineae bacterium]|nr:transposase [Anaerolineae bacterium]
MYDPNKHHRRSIRLREWDYSSPGAYFVTLCSYQRECLFGEINDGVMMLSTIGHFAAGCWLWLADRYPYVCLDEWTVMPNHLHGIIAIIDEDKGSPAGVNVRAPSTRPTRKPLGRLIGAFKTVSTKHVNILRDMPGVPLWQRNYYEHVIRNEADLQRIREYIFNNPASWLEDENHPDKIGA